MKKVFALLLALLVLALPLTLAAGATDKTEKDYSHLKGTTLNVYNWGEYISDGSEGSLDVNAEFEKRYGITVNYTNFESNENMYTKLKNGGANYDVIIPSDYMIARLAQQGMLEELDFSNIPNYQYILDKYKGLYFDAEQKYSVPYTVGMVGLIYNTKMVSGTPDSWSLMWDEQYKGEILMFNNPRDAFGIAQCLLGQSVNTTDKAEWDAAAAKLAEQKPLVSSYVMDEVFNKMEGGEAAIAAYYAGDYLTMHDINPDLAFVYPKEGVNFFVDAMCVPKGANNKEAAELYINFMLEEDIAVANANYICYASPNKLVLESDDYDLKDDPILYPDESAMPKTQIFELLDEDTQLYMNEKWNEVKIESSNNTGVYIALAVVAALVAVFAVIKIVRSKKRKAMY